REAVHRFDFLWTPSVVRNFAKGSAVQAKNRRNAQQRRFIEIALEQLANYLRSDTSFFGQFRIGNAQAALRFSDDVGSVVFEWNHSLSVYQLRLRRNAQAHNQIQRQFLKRSRDLSNSERSLRFLFDRCHCDVIYAAGNNVIERREIAADIQCEPVHGYPMANADAD